MSSFYHRGITLLNAATATGAGALNSISTPIRSYQAFLSTSTTPAATVDVEVSNDGTHWLLAGTITLSGSADSEGFITESAAPWLYDRGNVTSISGASATVTLIRGE